MVALVKPLVKTPVTTRAPLKLMIALAAIGVAAAVLRLIGVTFGLPAVYNPDEIAIMSRALAFAKGDLNPHNFLYPTFYFYVLFAWVGASFVVTWLLGIVPSLAPGVPVSVFVTTISFAIFLVCWLIGRRDSQSVAAG